MYVCMYVCMYMYTYLVHACFWPPPPAPPISMLTSGAPRPREKRPFLTKKSSRDINIEIGGRGGELVSVHVCTYTWKRERDVTHIIKSWTSPTEPKAASPRPPLRTKKKRNRSRGTKWNLDYLRLCYRASDNQVSFQILVCCCSFQTICFSSRARKPTRCRWIQGALTCRGRHRERRHQRECSQTRANAFNGWLVSHNHTQLAYD